MTPLPIIIDCDPGQDDVINILLALASPEQIRLQGITTVGGNVGLDKTQRNARLTCDLAGVSDVPVYAGCAAPLMRPLTTAEAVHGETGIDGLDIHEPRLAVQTEHGVDYLVRTLTDSEPGKETLVATGPLTNIAMALNKAPDIARRIGQIVIMGGAMREGGNVTPSAEFNIANDPHAADIVFRSGIPIALFGLDVTHQLVMSQVRRDRLRYIGTPAAVAVANMLDFSVRHDESKYGTDGAPLHDPCTLLYLLNKDLFDLKRCAVCVETGSTLTYGHTAVDFWGVTERVPNTLWAYAIDHEAAFDLLCERIARL